MYENNAAANVIGRSRWIAGVSILLLAAPLAWADAPIIHEVTPDPGAVMATSEYVKQLGLQQGTAPVTWTLLQNPAGAVINPSTGLINGWTPTTGDVGSSFLFEAQATNADGSDTESWNVEVEPVQPVNNGFDARQIFAIRQTPNPGVPGSPQMGTIKVYRESDGSFVRDFTGHEGWISLTFSGVGTSDARCYALRRRNTTGVGGPFDPPFNDLDIRYFKSDGNVQDDVFLSSLPGWVATNNVLDGSIRYSTFHNTLFVGFDRNGSVTDPAIVHEIDLGLSQILNTYTGPNTNTGGRVNVEINPHNGLLYMINNRLGNDGAGSTRGDLVAFDTSGGSTNVYTTLVNGQTFSIANPSWTLPNCVIYRRTPIPANDTLVVFMDGSPFAALELWADTTAHPVDGNGNLQLKGTLTTAVSRGQNGRQSLFNDNIHYGALLDGFGTIEPDDTLIEYLPADARWVDADSPPYVGATVFAPILNNLPPDPDQTVAQFEYIRQLGLSQGTAPVTWTLLQAPPGALIDQNGLISGWKPTAAWVGTPAFFEVQASNTAGSASASWSVDVIPIEDVTNNGFHVNHIFAIRLYENPGPGGASWPMMGKIEIYEEGTGFLVNGGYTNIEGWDSLALSGTGTNDAFCYALRRWNTAGEPAGIPHYQPPYDSINIRKFRSDGNVEGSQFFGSQMAGWQAGTDVREGSIRYSRFHNTLFVGVDRNQGVVDPALVYEINLSLSAIVRTYTGPNTNPGGQINLDINPNNGMLYVISQNLGDDNPGGGPLGDLVGFPNGVTSNPTTLINGQTFAADGQPNHNLWGLPNNVIFRRSLSGLQSEDTLVVFMNQPPYAVMEFWADTDSHPVDVNGNLQLKGLLSSVTAGANGQLDVMTRDIHYAAFLDGFGSFKADDNLIEYRNGEVDYIDAGSPPYPFVPGICNIPFADFDQDDDVDHEDFAFFQLCYSGPAGSYPLVNPAGCECADRVGHTPGSPPDGHVDAFDFAEFVQCRSGPGVPLNPACAD